MTTNDLETLKASKDKVVKITTSDGETLIAKVLLVSEEDEDVLFELISTTHEGQYEKFDQQPAYAIDFKKIESVEAVA
jgi:hypothetical protein